MKIKDLNIPTSVKKCLNDLVEQYELELGDNLSGVYLHGSIAMDCFNPESSDIDVLVVVKNKLSNETKRRLGQLHIELSNRHHKNIELSVVLAEVLENFSYPTPFEFHYSDDHKDNFIKGEADFSPRKDPDLAAHFVITKKQGIALVGKPASEVFPDVPKNDYLDSISKDSDWSYQNIMKGEGSGECSVPKYAVLNFCRVLAFIKGGLITSKKTGAE